MMTKSKNSLEAAQALRKIKIFSVLRLFCACIGLVISVTLISLASLSFKDMIFLYKEQISHLKQIIDGRHPGHSMVIQGIPHPDGLVLVLTLGIFMLLGSFTSILIYSWMIQKLRISNNQIFDLFRLIGSCIGVVFSIRISEYAMLTIWLILRLVELFNIIFEIIIGVIVYSYISTTEGYVVLGFSTLHSICEIYGWSITKSMYLKDSLTNNVHNQEKV